MCIYKIRITSVYLVEIHDCKSHMQNKNQSLDLLSFLKVSVRFKLLGVK